MKDRCRAGLVALSICLACCGRSSNAHRAPAPSPVASNIARLPTTRSADGLSEAYAQFKAEFTGLTFEKIYTIGYGYHPALSTEAVRSGKAGAKARAALARGQARIRFAEGRIEATLDSVPANGKFELWFVKNVPGPGRTAAPELGDEFLKVGSFDGKTSSGGKSLDVVLGRGPRGVDFDLDLVVVTRVGQDPAVSRIAVGARSLFEKRWFREQAGLSAPPVAGALSDEVETNDPLVKRGAYLFAHETFGGNGRTCSTCHRLERNFTLDPAFIATLPASDPLFVAETNPALAGLENSKLLRERALVLSNADGYDQPPVLRSVQHLFALATTQGLENATLAFPRTPPDHALGWSGDGAPGRGTLHEFAFGAIAQHLTRDLRRRSGIDFRIPSQEELDALEAFELFNGRQKLVDARPLALREPKAEAGRKLFMNSGTGGKCAICHLDLGTLDEGNPPLAYGVLAPQGVRRLTPELPTDDGFLSPVPGGAPAFVRALPVPGGSHLFGGGAFNVPSLIEVADTMGAFHNNAATDLETAVGYYASDTFRKSEAGAELPIQLAPLDIENIGAFLRTLNAAENMREIRKRVEFVRENRAPGNSAILAIARNDAEDALADLAPKALSPVAQADLAAVKALLTTASASPDAARPLLLEPVVTKLAHAKADLFAQNPNDEL